MHQNLLYLLVTVCTAAKVVFAADCSLFTIGQCDRSVLEVVDLPGGNVSACQEQCQQRSGCREFQFHLLSESCTLSSAQHPTCNLVAGPASPAAEQCDFNQLTGCAAFTREDCSFQAPNNIMDHIPDPIACQMFMNELGPEFGGGNHFVFELKPKGKCSMLLSGETTTCLAVSGPVQPNYDDCNLQFE